MKKIIYLFLSCFLNVNLFSVLLISIPKSGTHLLFKSVVGITKKPVIFDMNNKNGHNLYGISSEDLKNTLQLYFLESLHSHLRAYPKIPTSLKL